MRLCPAWRREPRGTPPTGGIPAAPGLRLNDWGDLELYDDVTGKCLPSDLQRIVMAEGLIEMHRRTLWDVAKLQQCIDDTGAKPITARWIVADKMARHIVGKCGGNDMDDLFASVPPFEFIKMLYIKVAQNRFQRTPRKDLFINISIAHLYSPVEECVKAYVDLPPECSVLGMWKAGLFVV